MEFIMNTNTNTNTAKPGYKTSEFWVVIVTSILTWLNHSGALGSLQIPVESLSSLIILAVTYVVGRTGVKAAVDIATNIKKS